MYYQQFTITSEAAEANHEPKGNEALAEYIKLCFLDPEFPKFVVAVEKEMAKILTNELNASRG